MLYKLKTFCCICCC